jgi:uncharacterized protein (DUF1499 family)
MAILYLLALLPICSSSPNCVSSEAEDPAHYVAPFSYQGEGSEAIERLKQVALSQPRVTLVKETPTNVQFEAKSKWLGFVDDVYCALDDEKKEILIASLSRVGYYDMGVNRARIETWRTLFNQSLEASQQP